MTDESQNQPEGEPVTTEPEDDEPGEQAGDPVVDPAPAPSPEGENEA